MAKAVEVGLGILGALLAPQGEEMEARSLRAWGSLLSERWGTPTVALRTLRQAPDPNDRRVADLSERLSLDDAELLALCLCMAVELEPEAGRLIAWLQAPVGASRPSLGLISRLLREVQPESSVPAILAGTAIATGLLVLTEGGGPSPERCLAMPSHLLLAAGGKHAWLPGASTVLEEKILLPASLKAEIQRQAEALVLGEGRVLLLRSGHEGEARVVAAELCELLGRKPLFVENANTVSGLVPWLLLGGYLPVFVKRMAPSERFVLPNLPAWEEPVIVVAGPDGGVEGRGRSALSWKIPVPSAEERATLWQAHGCDPALAGALGRDHRHGPGRIASLAKMAGHRAAVAGRGRTSALDVVEASRQGDSGGLDALAQPIPVQVEEEGLVLAESARRDLEILLARCRQREGLAGTLGVAVASRYGAGVRALFLGPSGTGKTLGASWLAGRLALPLYRVDLASVVSKYIGETEKNLAELLARAEAAEVVLFFDEADSLFGKRTEVNHSNDRFANAQTNYLLQRIESYEGIVILASNSRSRFDPAFSRRIDVVIEFPAPGPDERRRLWEAHLGRGHALSPRDINRLAAHCHLAGGNVRNVVLAAAVLAAEAGHPLGWSELLRGLSLECRKLGLPMPSGLEPEPPPPSSPSSKRRKNE